MTLTQNPKWWFGPSLSLKVPRCMLKFFFQYFTSHITRYHGAVSTSCKSFWHEAQTMVSLVSAILICCKFGEWQIRCSLATSAALCNSAVASEMCHVEKAHVHTCALLAFSFCSDFQHLTSCCGMGCIKFLGPNQSRRIRRLGAHVTCTDQVKVMPVLQADPLQWVQSHKFSPWKKTCVPVGIFQRFTTNFHVIWVG